ncbi:MAG: hypothetical protein QM831_43485 [Kofleriaceae bacterium]
MGALGGVMKSLVGVVVVMFGVARADDAPSPLACSQVLQCLAQSRTQQQGQACTARATPRALYYLAGIERCRRISACTTQGCFEGTCKANLGGCRANTDPADAGMPFAFFGEWSYGSVSASGFYSPSTGWRAAASSGSAYTFKEDGTYEFAQAMTSKFSTCGAGVMKYARGAYRLDNGQLTLIEKTVKVSTADSCNHKAAANDVKPETMTFDMMFVPKEFSTDPELTLMQNGKPWSNPMTHN